MPLRHSRLFSLAFALLLLAFACSSVLAAQSTPETPPPAPNLDLSTYQSELARIQELSESAISAKDEKQLLALRSSLPLHWIVSANDQQFTVSTAEIRGELLSISLNFPLSRTHVNQLALRLRNMQREAAALQYSVASPRHSDADAKLKSILSRNEFQESAGPSAMEILQARITRWLAEHIFRLLDKIHIRKGTGNILGWAIIFSALFALFYYAYRALNKNVANPAFKAEATPFPSDARHWLAEAQAASERGDFREAIHCAYWASVARLEDLRLLTRDRARTPRESLRLLDSQPRMQSLFRPLASSFELIWYGFRPASSADWLGAKDHLEKIGCL